MVSTRAGKSALSECTDNSHSDHSGQGELVLEADVEKSVIQLLLSSAEQELSLIWEGRDDHTTTTIHDTID